MTTTTETKTYSKTELIKHFFSNAYSLDDSFVLLPGSSGYILLYDQSEQQLDRMINRKEILDYITFTHILSIIAELDDFFSDAQLKRVANELEVFE